VGHEGFIDFTKMAKDLSKASLLNDDDESWGKDFVDFKECNLGHLVVQHHKDLDSFEQSAKDSNKLLTALYQAVSHCLVISVNFLV
jgi:hypothetical protein